MKRQIRKDIGVLGIAGLYLLLATSGHAAQPDKIDICHAPPDNPANTQLIEVGAKGGATADHLSHGDWLATPAMCDAIADNDCDGVPDDTALDDADCEAQLGAGAICDDGECIRPACFSFTNTEEVDLAGGTPGAGWFDACVDDQTTQVRVTLRDLSDNIVYQATGTKVGVWSFDQLTSTASLNVQYTIQNHNNLITLDNGDLLRISGKAANNGGCGGDQGNGYVIMIYAASPSIYYREIKMLVAPFERTGPFAGVRSFAPWTAEYEISWNGGASDMGSCAGFFGGQPLVPFQGKFEFEVF